LWADGAETQPLRSKVDVRMARNLFDVFIWDAFLDAIKIALISGETSEVLETSEVCN